MPVVHEYANHRGKHHVKASVEGKVITFQVSPMGESYLLKHKLSEGAKLTREQFSFLRSRNWIYTGGTGTEAQDAKMTPQQVLDQTEMVLRTYDGFGKEIQRLPSSIINRVVAKLPVLPKKATRLPTIGENGMVFCPHCSVKVSSKRYERHLGICPKIKEAAVIAPKLIESVPVSKPIPKILVVPVPAIPELLKIQIAIKNAMNQLYKKDKQLLDLDANERSLTHRLALYMDPLFPGWNVDCEYNRKGSLPKKMMTWQCHPQFGNKPDVTVYPDINVHKRSKDENFLVIEVKSKSLGDSIDEYDHDKIKAYIEELGYRFGLWIAFNFVKENAVTKWFINENGKCKMLD